MRHCRALCASASLEAATQPEGHENGSGTCRRYCCLPQRGCWENLQSRPGASIHTHSPTRLSLFSVLRLCRTSFSKVILVPAFQPGLTWISRICTREAAGAPPREENCKQGRGWG